jgi:hypothetical protein
MKSPLLISKQLAKQWQSANHREMRLLSADSWPLKMAIGKPTGHDFLQTNVLKQHLQQWRDVCSNDANLGEIEWAEVKYRNAQDRVNIPLYWIIKSPSQWVAACRDKSVTAEYQQLQILVQGLDEKFHSTVIRQRNLILEKPTNEVIRAGQLAMQLSKGCAQGKPLRALAIAGIDSKFFERHRSLIIQFLDVRFSGNVSEQGLEVFLNASNENDHWLLVVPLAEKLLPFQQQRVRASELARHELKSDNILIIENEQCLHQLPPLPQGLKDTIVILGAGLNLSWLSASWLSSKKIAYWGDMDSWGLKMLGQARLQQPHLSALLMTKKLFQQHQEQAVIEPSPAGEEIPAGLNSNEAEFYRYLLSCEKGRLEQEFLPQGHVGKTLKEWLGIHIEDDGT